MPLPAPTAEALERRGLSLQQDVPLAKETWWRAGGPADGFAELRTLDELVAAQQATSSTDCPLVVHAMNWRRCLAASRT